MAEFDHGVKMVAATAGRQLARVAGVASDRWTPLESTLQVTTERLADRVFLARRKRDRFIVYFEFLTSWNKMAPWAMLAKSGLLSEREQLPTVCIPVILLPRGYKGQGQFRLEAVCGPTQQLWYRPLCLWMEKPQPWWESEPGLMALYPLCQHGQKAREAVLHAASAIEKDLPGEIERGDGLALLSIFGELAYPRLDIQAIIGSEKMKESRFARSMRELGQVEQARTYILDLLRLRFGEARVLDLRDPVNAVEELPLLNQLFHLASTCSAPDEFRSALPVKQSIS